MKRLIFIFLLLAGCSKPKTPLKPLASVWSTKSAPAWTVNLTNYKETSAFTATIHYNSGGTCEVTASNTGFFDQQDGDNSSGQMTFTGSVAIESVAGMPSCDFFNDVWSYYVLESQGLLLCNSVACVELR